ncbi:arylsulfatase [Mycobacterium sp. CVI_P3]|uniref:Arylsulfatase n=1 Tax=Mycobacterium pinniadriaticum TaxID=2994102 RepID=A0ABT3S8H2_9MYCO|nr:arylsulfatase [Mycobacterium pinniadriaticum]MCX2929372.1 arylsulfatase [Mycobacterium pinniadriaticum]MCX2935796.1 arylsulfatase [Mycobacterium pinniadriaticum]
MAVEFQGKIAEDIRDSVPDWGPYRGATAPEGAPNVLYLLWDDTGIATWDCFGGLVEMPNMRRIADHGIRLTQFHTTALCSPTRAALLTGRNPTTVGVSSVVNLAEGYPGQNGRIPAQTALMSEVLAERGWSTYAVGKWHLTPPEDCHAAGSRRYWPLSRGFDRYYGFLDGMTDQWYPSLVTDSRPIDPPATPEQGYHLSKDLADNAIGFLRDHRAAAPDKPWFMYLCPGAGHSPHQVDTEWADKYRGRFDMGYERYRDIALANQKALGLLPDDTELSPMNPYTECTSAAGLPWPEHDTVTPWDSLSDDEKRVSCRMAEVFAGFLSYTDAQIGRILDYLEQTGQLDNTIVIAMSDNGASGEGGPSGTLDEFTPMRGGVDAPPTADRYDEFGGPGTKMNYSNGWAMAFNTPYKLFKRYASHEGGIADPCVLSWPRGLTSRGEVRDHYVHVSDITPTVYDLLGIDPPELVKGIVQEPLDGVSCAAALRDSDTPSDKHTQFYSMMGTRGIWHDGWFASAVHPPTSATLGRPGWSRFGEDRWELFRIETDRSQIRDLAAEHPDTLDELKALWHQEALRCNGYPLNDLSVAELVTRGMVNAADAPRHVQFYPDTPAGRTPMSGLVGGRSFTLRAPVAIDSTDAEGVIFSQGDRSGGHALYLAGGRLHYVGNIGGEEQALRSTDPIRLGRCVFGVEFTRTGSGTRPLEVVGDLVLTVDDREVATFSGMRMPVLDPLQALSAGRSVGYSVSADYASPNPLRGGVVEHVTVDFSDAAAHHHEVIVELGYSHD